MLNRKFGASAAIFGVALFSGVAINCANAATVSYTYNQPAGSVSFSQPFDLQLFDTSLGTLTGIQITLAGDVTPEVAIQNFSGSPQTFSDASTSGLVTITGPGGTSASATVSYSNVSGIAQPTTPSFVPDIFSGSPVALSDVVNVLAADFGTYEGSGLGSFTFTATSGDFTSSGTPGGPLLFFGGAALADGSVTIEYTYAATPLPAALPLFASGLGGLGLLGWRRKRKAAALAA